jgi:hypothetical protein
MQSHLADKALLVILIIGIGILLWGAWVKMRDGQADWGGRTRSDNTYQRHRRSAGTFWISVGSNIVLSVVLGAMALAIIFGKLI